MLNQRCRVENTQAATISLLTRYLEKFRNLFLKFLPNCVTEKWLRIRLYKACKEFHLTDCLETLNCLGHNDDEAIAILGALTRGRHE